MSQVAPLKSCPSRLGKAWLPYNTASFVMQGSGQRPAKPCTHASKWGFQGFSVSTFEASSTLSTPMCLPCSLPSLSPIAEPSLLSSVT